MFTQEDGLKKLPEMMSINFITNTDKKKDSLEMIKSEENCDQYIILNVYQNIYFVKYKIILSNLIYEYQFKGI
jgi:hypothetical protein